MQEIVYPLAMRLDQWIKREGHGAKARLALATGLKFNTILYLAQGKHVPSGRTALLIESATGGEVTVRELLVAKPRAAKPKAKPKRKRAARTKRAAARAAA